MSRSNYVCNCETGVYDWGGPKYPKTAAAPVEQWRRRARVETLDRDQRRAYGEAVGEWIRAKQHSELMSALTPTPVSTRPLKHSPPSIERLKKYSRPNPFRMVGDPAERDEESLYKQLVRA